MSADAEWVTVATFQEHTQAVLAKSVLDAANIPCWLRDEHVNRLAGVYMFPFGGIKLQVHPADLDEASALLQQAREAEPPPESHE